ncbi:uncharacterized protein CANTADRAFT_43624 [Suhomyces tanzawaensis NRRL Y-17324]|uniref:PH domain-containing protein n=1 Tax=Suhomyces tanzawaensis NRRL Y-17324 TaxID=984487 RepID=A0A1E4SR44_9ASCO|nr:uncharacterized protein CANTADRAFT_43624 [Suhomyces tanzawaensis NRRL Y-17324]ODV81979.1 hypothetical protein CANTADRAFT_43624 [Suhomyces tanzawaensis NRRL Y-17324]
METLEIHSKDFLVKWVHAPDNSTIDWQVKPLKKSINLAIYKKKDEKRATDDGGPLAPPSPAYADEEQLNPPSNSGTKSRSSTFSSNLSNSDLTLLKNYNKLISDELVHGTFEVTKGGMFAFIFDNSFSKTTGKKVYFSLEEKESDDENPIQANGTTLRPKNGELLQSILSKRRRKKLQGFGKRYFILNFKYGTLSYFRVNDNKLRGQMPIKHSIVSANPKSREIIIDSGMEIWDLKALNDHDFTIWVDAFNQVKKSQGESLEEEESEVDDNILVKELESISLKLDRLKLETTNSSPETLAGGISNISQDVHKLLSRIKGDQETNGSRTNDAISVYSTNEFYDANEYADALSSGVMLLDLPNDDREIQDDDDDDLSSSSSESDGESPVSVIDPSGKEYESATSEEDDVDDLYPLPHKPVPREFDIPECDHSPSSFVSFIRKNVGKDLSTIAMPVDMNEPLSALQKYTEMFEYCDLVNNAVQESFDDSTGEKILRIAAFAISYVSSARAKIRNNRKPFNPLLGETFELVREDYGIRMVSEKVSHRPVVFAFHVESELWTFSFSPSPAQKIWGHSAEIITKGTAKLTIKKTGEVFTWSHPSTMLKNIIAGEKYTEPSSSMTIKSSLGYKAVIEFAKSGMFSGRSEDLTITAYDSGRKKLPYTVSGKWTESLTLKTNTTEKLIWQSGDLLPNYKKKFGFTKFTGTLNKITDLEKGKLPPTDSRLRPDIQVYERGNVDEAERLKVQLEEDQRTRRKDMETAGATHVPQFFKHVGGDEPDSGEWVYIKGEKSYWNRRKNGDWDGLTQLW